VIVAALPSAPHIIRLREPWAVRSDHETATFSRRFHAPTGLTPATRVDLVLEGLSAEALVLLNGAELSSATPVRRHDIRALLKRDNLLEIMQRASGDPQFGGVVRLEIFAN
jgi:hypothetical protein